MSTRAGELVVELPPGWTDSTEYVYFSQDERLSLRISRATMAPGTTPRSLVDSRLQKFTAIGEVKRMTEGDMAVKNRPASYSAVEVTPRPASDEDGKLGVRLLVIELDPAHAMVAILSGPAGQQTRLNEAWETFVRNLSFAGTP